MRDYDPEDKNKVGASASTPAPLSADSLREQIAKYMKYADNHPTDSLDAIMELIATALQTERQRIADSLPEMKTMDAAKSSGSDAGWGCTYGFNECLETVREVLTAEGSKLTSKGENET